MQEAVASKEQKGQKDEDDDPPAVERHDGSWILSGAASADVLTDQLGLSLPAEREYTTIAGFVLETIQHLPETGERFTFDRWTFEIVDLDGRKIDKLIACPPRRGRDEGEAPPA